MLSIQETSISPLIQAAYSPSVFSSLAELWRQKLSRHLTEVATGATRVLNWRDPEENLVAANRWMDAPITNVSNPAIADAAGQLMESMLSAGQNLHHPHYIGHQVPPSIPLAGLFDAISAVTNQVMAIYEMGPWATSVEHALVQRLCGKVGWQPELSSGLLTHGGSLANLTALLTARNVSIPNSWEEGVPAKAVLITNADAHYCVTRSAGILGLGARQVRKIGLDARRHIRLDELETELDACRRQKMPVIAVSACACATPTGAIDDLQGVAELCRKFGVWMHVDAAHGGALLMSRRYRGRLRGLELADSIVWDAHKMLFVPALCAAVLYRNRDHRFETFRQDAPYLFDPSAPGMADVDSGMRTIECTKRAVGFGLWSMWSIFGEQLFEDLVDRVIHLTETFHGMLNEEPDFETLHEPECNILAFRYLPEQIRHADDLVQNDFQRAVRTKLIRSGEFYIVQTTLNGQAALRVTVMNPLTTELDLQELIQAIRSTGASVLSSRA